MTNQTGLTAQGGPQNGQFYPLESGDAILGRIDNCNIKITWDPSISRKHARIYHQSGLYWLEDLGSTNHTYLTASDGQERQLQSNESVLLLEGGIIRLGKHVRFLVSGLTASQDEARQLIAGRLQQVLVNLYAGLKHLSPEDQAGQLEWLRDFESRLRSAKNPEDILRIASEGTQTLFGTIHQLAPSSDELPPLPENLPDPSLANQVNSILNFFITDIHDHLPEKDDKDG